MSRYQKGKTNPYFTEARDSEWQWHQLGHTQVCTMLQTDNHASTLQLGFLQAGCPSCRPTNSVKALKAHHNIIQRENCMCLIAQLEQNKYSHQQVLCSASYNNNNDNNNNNNSHVNVYGAVIMTKVIARVHPIHLINVD